MSKGLVISSYESSITRPSESFWSSAADDRPFRLLVLLRFRWHTLRRFAFARFRYRRVCHLGQRRTIRGRSKDAAGRMIEFRRRICVGVATWPSALTPSASRVHFGVSFLAKRKKEMLDYNYFKISTKIQNINLSRSPRVIVNSDDGLRRVF